MRINKYLATIIGIAIVLVLVFSKSGNTPTWQMIWPIFGASNQLVAAMVLLALGTWVIKGLKKKATFIMYPMCFMLVTTIVALVQMLFSPKTSAVIMGADVILLILTALLLREEYVALKDVKKEPDTDN